MTYIFGDHQENTLAQMREVAQNAEYTALMADGHLGYVMPIGGVAAYDNKASVVGVGFDIACGNCAIRTDLTAEKHLSWPGGREQIADEIQATISFGVGRTNRSNDAPIDHPLFDYPEWEAIPQRVREALKLKARDQLGTVGSGNHYVDIFADEQGRIWVGVHFGSRGLGHTIASGFLALAQGKQWGARVPEQETLLDLDTPLGSDYWHAMGLAGDYAYAGREWVTRKVVSLLGANELDMVHNHHNFAWRERHFGRDLIVVRKGATPAFPGQRGFVGGSMGDQSVILEGNAGASHAPDGGACENALYSTVHGAGRVMSRTEAAGKRHRKGPHKGQLKDRNKPGKVTPDAMRAWLAQEGVILRGGALDEAPQAYRRLPDVLRAQGDTVRVLHTLQPLIVVMAGANEYDPYKD